jgi:hypothetical protein
MPQGPLYDQSDSAERRFIQPKALVVIAHKGCEYVMWRKADGSLAATPVTRLHPS